MKFFTGLFTLLVLFALGSQTFGAERYAVASGNWGSTTTWSATRGGAPGAAVPTKDDTVWIPGPYKVIIEASGKTCYNLTVENGASVYGLIVNPTSSQVYIRVYGDYVQNDGIIGYDPAKGPDSLSNVCVEAYRSNATLTFKGNGISKISRIRNGSSYSNIVFVIDQDLTLTYPGSTGSGGMGFYPQSAGNTLWVKAGRTLTCVNYCNIGVNSSTSSNGPATTFLIDGTLKMGANSTFQLMPQAGAIVTLTVNGTLDAAGSFKPTGTAGDTSSVVVNAGGVLKLGSSGDGSAQFTSANQIIRGQGSVQLAGGTMVISNPAGLDPVNGHIRTASKTYAQTAGYTFAGSKAAMATGSDFPAKAAYLTVNDTTGTLTLTNDLTADSLNLAFGNVVTGTKKLTISPAGGVIRTNGYVIGNLVKSVAAGAAAKAFEIGTANGYSPVSLQFGNVTTGGTLTVSAREEVHPNAVTPAENLKRYWTISNNGTAFDNYSAAFTYLPADFNTGIKEADDEANLIVNKYTSSAWTKPALGTTVPGGTNDGGSIQVTGLTSFGDFAITKKAAPTTIKDVKVDANNDFIPDNLNKTFTITGVVTSIDFTASSTSNNNYYVQDATGGILLFAKPRLNKALNVGDSIMVTGSVMQFRGVTEIAPADSNVGAGGNVVVLKTGAKVPAPIEISVKDINSEKYEGSLVTVKGLSRKPWSTAWPAVTKNANIIVYAGTDSTILFIDQDTDIDGTTEPAWPQDITGIATQYTSSATVYNDGYEIQPRSTADFRKTSGLRTDLPAGIPADFHVEQNYPNPFNPNTTIRYALPFESNVKITVYNLIGEVVSEVVNDVQQAGYHETVFNANNLASGIYLYSITAHSTNGSKDFSSVRKMILMK